MKLAAIGPLFSRMHARSHVWWLQMAALQISSISTDLSLRCNQAWATRHGRIQWTL
jgi:hypothetical protein